MDSKARTSEIELRQLAEEGDEGEVDPELRSASVIREPDSGRPQQRDQLDPLQPAPKGNTDQHQPDIVQHTVADGQWNFVKPSVPESELPQIGDFFLLDAENAWTQEWAAAKTLRINGGDGRAAELLKCMRHAVDFQDVALNTFAHYITRTLSSQAALKTAIHC